MHNIDPALFWATPETELGGEPDSLLSGFPSHPYYRQAVEHALRAEGFSRDDAVAWAEAWSCDTAPEEAVRQLIAFDDAGMDVATAIRWHEREYWADDAIVWARRGFTPAQACLLVNDTVDADDWLDSTIPAKTVIAMVAAGVTPDEAPGWMARPAEERDAALAALSALRHSHDGGVDQPERVA